MGGCFFSWGGGGGVRAAVRLVPTPHLSTSDWFVTWCLMFGLQVAAGWIREYHDWQWDEGATDQCFPKAQLKFSPDYSEFKSDPFYQSRAAAGLQTHVVVQGRPLCQFGGATPNQTRSNWKCVDSNSIIDTPKTQDPGSYTQLGAYLFQYAARYGRTKVADSKLTLGAGQVRASRVFVVLPLWPRRHCVACGDNGICPPRAIYWVRGLWLLALPASWKGRDPPPPPPNTHTPSHNTIKSNDNKWRLDCLSADLSADRVGLRPG